MKIAFHDRFICERGSTIAMIDYANYNQSILNNTSVIIYNKNTILNNNVFEQIQQRFVCYGYDNYDELAILIKTYNIDAIYSITTGIIGERMHYVTGCYNIIHSMFGYDVYGDVFACVSEWKSMQSQDKIAFVPHIVNMPPSEQTFRTELGIPNDAIVYGRYGGADTFDISFVHQTIHDYVTSHPNVYFLFANTNQFCDGHPQIIHIEPIVDTLLKSKFVNTCDAMIHARMQGESFGIAVGEFSVMNKPIITYGKSDELAHIAILGDKALVYNSPDELLNIFNNFTVLRDQYTDWNCYRDYSPEKIMKIFNDVFLSGILKHKQCASLQAVPNISSVSDCAITFDNSDRCLDHAKAILIGDAQNNNYWIAITHDDCKFNETAFNLRAHKKLISDCTKKHDIIVNTSHNNFVVNYLASVFPYDVCKNKNDYSSYQQYKYAIVIDDNDGNYTIDDLLNSNSDKLDDSLLAPLLCECVVFYHGSKDVNIKTVIPINVTDASKSIDIIKKTISDGFYENNIDVVKQQKQSILQQYDTFDNDLFLASLNKIVLTRLANEQFTNNLFDKIYLMNLPKFVDRFNESNRQLRLRHIKYEKYCAINGSIINTQNLIDNSIIKSSFDGIHKKGLLGLVTTHYYLFKEHLKNNRKLCLYIEDDIRLHHTFCDQIAENWKHIPSDADIIVFTYWFVGGNKTTSAKHIGGNIYKITGKINGGACFAVTLSGAKKFITKQFPLTQSTDCFNHVDFNIYAFDRIPKVDSAFYADTATIPNVTLNIYGIATTQNVTSCINSFKSENANTVDNNTNFFVVTKSDHDPLLDLSKTIYIVDELDKCTPLDIINNYWGILRSGGVSPDKLTQSIQSFISKKLDNETFTNNLFDRKILINVDKHIDRFRGADKELKLRHINYEKFSAIDGVATNVSDMIKNKIITPQFNAKHRQGVLGLTATYHALFMNQIKNNYPLCLYFEDDVRIHYSFCDQIAENWKYVPAGADVIALSYWFCDGNLETHTQHIGGNVYRVIKKINGTTCIAVTLAGAIKMINSYFPLTIPFDNFNLELLNVYAFGKVPNTNPDFYIDKTTMPKTPFDITGIASTRNIDSSILQMDKNKN